MTEIHEVPEGRLKIPGYILTYRKDAWFTQDGRITKNFNERGVWATLEEVDLARDRFCADG